MAALLAACPVLYGQAANDLPSIMQRDQVALEGSVVDPEGHGIRMAHLTLASIEVPSGQTGFSGDDARFFFNGLRPGNYTLTVSAAGFETSSQTVDMRLGPQSVRVVLQRRKRSPAPATGGVVASADLKVSAKARRHYEEGQQLLQKKELEKALKTFGAAIEEDSNFPSAYSAMGVTYIQSKDFTRAKKAFEKALTLEEALGEAHLGLGLVANERKDYSEAERHLLRARQLLPTDWRVFYELGRSLYHQDRLEEAEADLVRGRELQPDYGNLRILLGNTYARKNKLPEALQEMRAFLKVSPKSPLAPKVRQTVKALEAEINRRK
ncbi:MAG: tetratricopeptide repeat protein [Acidobacteriota bacterium]